MQKSSHKEDDTGGHRYKNKGLMGLKAFIKYYLFRRGRNKQHTKTDSIAESAISSIYESEREIVTNIYNFSEKTVEDIMTPRSDIISVSHNSTLEELSNLIVKHSHTRTLIYGERLDHIIGFVHIKDLFRVITHSEKFSLKNLIKQHIVSPHSMKLIDLLAQMQVKKIHIAVIVDEYGCTDGIVTIKDIMEEIVGKIGDEHDIDEEVDRYKLLRPGLLLTNARVEIGELENIIGIKLKTQQDEFDTIGGLIMAKAGHVPEKGQIINLENGVVAEIIESTPRTIRQIKITYPRSL